MPAASTTCCWSSGDDVEHDAQRLEHVGGAAGRGGGAVAVLDHPGAGAGGHDRGHRRDVDGVGAVAAGADDVDRVPADLERRREVEHGLGEAGDLVDRLALGRAAPSRSPAIWAGVASPPRIWRIAQAVVARSASRRGDQPAEHARPGRARPPAAAPARSRRARPGLVASRSSWATTAGSRTGSIGWPTTPSARDQVASQASSGRPVRTSSGGQRRISSFSWRHRPIPPGHGLAVEDRQVDAAAVHRREHGRLRGDLLHPDGREVTGHAPAQGEPDVLAGAPVGRVEQHGQGARGRLVRGGCSSSLSPARAGRLGSGRAAPQRSADREQPSAHRPRAAPPSRSGPGREPCGPRPRPPRPAVTPEASVDIMTPWQHTRTASPAP